MIEGINFEGLQLNTFDILTGGIGYGAIASQLMAHGMKAIGSSDLICNLPFCLEGIDYSELRCEMVDPDGKAIPNDEFIRHLADKIQDGVSHFNLPLDFNGHASLMHGTVTEIGKIEIVFFDSLSLSEKEYQKRYDSIMIALKELLPKEVSGYTVCHILDQGGKESSGCGYYTLQTAHLLKKKTAKQLLRDYEEEGVYLYSKEDDVGIRCELAIRTILHDGIDSIDIRKYRWTLEKKIIFHKLGVGSMYKVMQFAKERITEAST